MLMWQNPKARLSTNHSLPWPETLQKRLTKWIKKSKWVETKLVEQVWLAYIDKSAVSKADLLLGFPALRKKESIMSASLLETFPNQFPDREYEVEIVTPEFTAVCPKTGQPDFADLTIRYVPGDTILEMKALKLYLFSYRNRGIYYEHSINSILDDLVNACHPRKMTVIGLFNPRGGMTSKITAVHEASANQSS